MLHSIERSQNLSDIKSFAKRGHRRKSAFLNQSGFSLALRMSRIEKNLRPDEQRFWEKNFLEIHQMNNKTGV